MPHTSNLGSSVERSVRDCKSQQTKLDPAGANSQQWKGDKIQGNLHTSFVRAGIARHGVVRDSAASILLRRKLKDADFDGNLRGPNIEVMLI